MGTFKNKVALVTGGASGIGRELCNQLGARGATVIVTDINGNGAKVVASEILKAGGKAISKKLDVTKEKQVHEFFHKIAQDYEYLDFVFNNAGICIFGEARDMSSEQWKRITDININGGVYGTIAAYEIMVNQGHGHIINTASYAGLGPVPTLAAYAMTKHAVVGLTTSLREEAKELGVNVSCVCPGVVGTNIFNAAEGLNINVNEFRDRVSMPEYPAEKAARDILKGVAQNKSKIIFPLSARNVYRVTKSAPEGLLEPVYGRMGSTFRKHRRGH